MDLSIAPGSFVLVGDPSGGGKSTLAYALTGLIPQTIPAEVRGHVSIAGLDPRQRSVAQLATRVGLVFQNPVTQLFNGTVEEEAMNLLGMLQEMAAVILQTIRLRGGKRRPWLGLRLFLVTTVANTLRYGDEVINAAAMRAFDLNGGRPAPLPLRRADLWLLALLAGCTGALLAVGMR